MNKSEFAVLAMFAALLVVPPPAQSDPRWSDAQQEVWQRVQTCNGYFYAKDMDKARACVHDDFAGWLYDQPVPRSKDYFKSIVPYFVKSRTIHASELRPIEILVLDNTAIVHYSFIEVSTDKQGNETVEQGR